MEKFNVLKSEISPHGRFLLHLHVGDRGDKYKVCVCLLGRRKQPILGGSGTLGEVSVSCLPDAADLGVIHHLGGGLGGVVPP